MKRIGAFLLVLMFALSGFQKIMKLGDLQTKQFTDVFKLPYNVAKALVFLAGVLEVIGSGLILMHEMKPTSKSKKTARQAVLALIAFTIAATLVFKVYPKFKMIQTLSNMSVLGGLILYYECLK